MRNSKPGDNVSPDESLRIHVPEISEGLSFHPLGKVICVDNEPSLVPYSSGKGSYYIQAPLSEWPGARQRIQNSP